METNYAPQHNTPEDVAHTMVTWMGDVEIPNREEVIDGIAHFLRVKGSGQVESADGIDTTYRVFYYHEDSINKFAGIDLKVNHAGNGLHTVRLFTPDGATVWLTYAA